MLCLCVELQTILTLFMTVQSFDVAPTKHIWKRVPQFVSFSMMEMMQGGLAPSQGSEDRGRAGLPDPAAAPNPKP